MYLFCRPREKGQNHGKDSKYSLETNVLQGALSYQLELYLCYFLYCILKMNYGQTELFDELLNLFSAKTKGWLYHGCSDTAVAAN